MKLVDRQVLENLIERLHLDEDQKTFLKARWLHYVVWWDNRANESKWKYLTLRSSVMIGGALIPALVSIHVPDLYTTYVRVASIGVGLLIAVSAGLEEIFRFGEIWREKRVAAELLKVEGFRYFQLVDRYRDNKSHQEA